MGNRIILASVMFALGFTGVARAQFTERALPCGGCPIALEEAMRRFQGIQAYFKSDVEDVDEKYQEWPPSKACSGDDNGLTEEAPPFPPDGFYGDDLCDPRRAADLVRDLAGKVKNAPFGTAFRKLDGEGFPDEAGTDSDFEINYPNLVADLPIGDDVTPANYCDVFKKIWEVLDKLRVIDVSYLPDNTSGQTLLGKSLIVTNGGGQAYSTCWLSCFPTVSNGYGTWKGFFNSPPMCSPDNPPPPGWPQIPYTSSGWSFSEIGITEIVGFEKHGCFNPDNPSEPWCFFETLGMKHVYANPVSVGTGSGSRGTGAVYVRLDSQPDHESNHPPIQTGSLRKYGSYEAPANWQRPLGVQGPEFSTCPYPGADCEEAGDPPWGPGHFGWHASDRVALIRPAFEHQPDLAVRKGGGCSTCEPGRVDAAVEGVNVRISMGTWEGGDAGYLLIRGDTLVGSGDELFKFSLAHEDPNTPAPPFNTWLGDGAKEMGTPDSIVVRMHPLRRPEPGFEIWKKVISPGGNGWPAVYGAVRQVVARDVLVDVVPTGDHKYEIRFYRGFATQQQHAHDADGFYDPTDLTLFKTIAVEHSMHAQSLGNDSYDVTGKLEIREIVGSPIRRTVFTEKVALKNWTIETPDTANSDIPVWKGRLPNSESWITNRRWEMGTGSGGTDLATRERVTHGTSGGDRTETRTILDISGNTASSRTSYFHRFGWGEALVRSDEPAQEGTRTTQWTWDQDVPRLLQVERPDGGWERYQYDLVQHRSKVIAQFLDGAVGAPESESRVVEYQYNNGTTLFADTEGIPESITARIERLLGAEVSRSYTIHWAPDGNVGDHGSPWFSDVTEIRCATLGAPANLKEFLEDVVEHPDTSIHSMTHTRRWSDNQSGRPAGSIVAEYDSSGILTLRDKFGTYLASYGFSENGTVAKSVRGPIATGLFPLIAHSDLAVRDGTASLSIRSEQGAELLSVEQDLQGTPDYSDDDIVLSRSTALERNDGFGRVTKVQHLDGTTESTSYDTCCGVTARTDREGIVTTYVYDEMRRVKEETRGPGDAAITMKYTYDAAGRVKTVTRVGSNNNPIQQRGNTYDATGRLISQVDALQSTTTYLRLVDQDTHHVTRRTILPVPSPNEAAPIRDEIAYLDGQPFETSGSGAHPVRYQYGVELDSGLSGGTNVRFTKEIRIGDGGAVTEWVKSYIDPLGRPYKTVFADGAVSRQFYNGRGEVVEQVDPDGATMLFRRGNGVEDASGLPGDADAWRGEWSLTAVDMNHNGQIDFDGTDRISKSRSFVTTKDLGNNTTADVTRSIQTVWTTDGNPTAILDGSISEASTDGLRVWSSQLGLESTSETTYTPAERMVMTVGTSPDGTQQVTVNKDGRLFSQATYAAPVGSNVKLTESRYSYDPHGRNTGITDTRGTATADDDRTTTIVYDLADQVYATTSPAPDANTPGQTRLTTRDALGRVTDVTLPDDTHTHTSYFPTGEVKKTWGSRAYPVEYTYDSQGRMKTLKTWQNFDEGAGSGSSGAATTTWNYDGQRGWLTSKQYNDGNGPSYEYWPSGRLKKRTWSQGRNITTNYAYDASGAPSGIDYSDTTPDISYTYDRRGRLVGVSDAVGTRTLSYGDAGQMLIEDFTSGVLDPVRVENHYDGFFRRDWNKLFASNALRNQVEFAYETATLRLSRVIKDGADSAEYAYDAHSNLVHTLTVKHGTTAVTVGTKAYDNIDRLSSIAWHSAGVADDSSAYTYNTADQRTRVDVGDGSYWLYTYDSMGQVTSGKRYFVHTNGDIPVPGQQFEYSFDDIGNRVQTKAGGNQQGTGLRPATYTPNLLNQYTARDVPGSVDIMGMAPSTSTVTVAGAAPDFRLGDYFQKLLSWVNTAVARFEQVQIWIDQTNGEMRLVFIPKTPEMFTYDPDGNLLTDGRWNYTWDGENHLVAMETRAGLPSNLPLKRLEFVYDYLGRRNVKRVYKVNIPEVEPIPEGPEQNQGSGGITPQEEEGGTPEPAGVPGSPTPPSPIWTLDSTVKYVWDGWNLLAEFDGVNANIRTYAWGLDLSGSEQGAGGIGGLLFETDSAGLTCHLTYDGNGNVRGLRDAAGGIAAAYEYGAFGETLTATGAASGSNPFRFSTKYADAESGLLYYGYRYYNPGTGRWISADPIGEQSDLNLLAFVHNCPISTVDTLGLRSQSGEANQSPPQLWTASGINNWDGVTFNDYVSSMLSLSPATSFVSKLGTVPAYLPGKPAASAGGKYVKGFASERALDFEAEQFAFSRTAGEFRRDDCKPTKVVVFLVGPKTTTRPRPDSRYCDVKVNIYFSPWDDVPNQSGINAGGSAFKHFWQGFALNGFVEAINTNFTPGFVPTGSYPHHDLGAFIGATGKLKNTDLWDVPDARAQVQHFLASDADYVFVGHSQGANILMHVLNQVCNARGIGVSQDGKPQ